MAIYTEADWARVDPLLGTMSDRKVSTAVSMSRDAVARRRRKLGIHHHRDERHIDWQPIDRFLGVISDCEVSRRFGVSTGAASYRRQQLGIDAFGKASKECVPTLPPESSARLYAIQKRPTGMASELRRMRLDKLERRLGA